MQKPRDDEFTTLWLSSDDASLKRDNVCKHKLKWKFKTAADLFLNLVCKHWKCSMAFNYLLASVIISLPITNVIKAFCSLENGSTVFWDYKFFNNDLIQIAAVSENRRILRNNLKLTHILPQVSFYTLWKNTKLWFLMFAGGIQRD